MSAAFYAPCARSAQGICLCGDLSGDTPFVSADLGLHLLECNDEEVGDGAGSLT